MKVAHSRNRPVRTPEPAVAAVLREVSSENLQALVKALSFPRNYVANKRANRKARDLLLKRARELGYAPSLQGNFDNIVMASGDVAHRPMLLFGAHYDSVPRSPGADDNASAVAVCLECARLIKKHSIGSVTIVLFNREEDGLLGSNEFVAYLAEQRTWAIQEAHIFEMVGYRDSSTGSQTMPPGLPIRTRDVGDFLALLANRASNRIAEDLLTLAACYVPQAMKGGGEDRSGRVDRRRWATARSLVVILRCGLGKLLCFVCEHAKFLQHFFSSAEECNEGSTERCRSSIRQKKIVVVIQKEHVVHRCPRHRTAGLRGGGLNLPVFWRLTLKHFDYSQGALNNDFRFAT